MVLSILLLPLQAFGYKTPERMVLDAIESDSAGIWGFDVTKTSYSNTFVPSKGALKVCKAENTVIIGFYLSEKNLAFYRQTFADDTRKPLGFEFDVIDHKKVFDPKHIVSVKHSFNPNVVYTDSGFGDSYARTTYGVAVKDPAALQPNRWHITTIRFSDHTEVNQGDFTVQVQLVGDLRKLRDEQPSLYKKYSWFARGALDAWFLSQEDVDGNNFFNLRKAFVRFYRPEFFTSYDRVRWNGEGKEEDTIFNDFLPYSCDLGAADDFSSEKESSGGSVASGNVSNAAATGTFGSIPTAAPAASIQYLPPSNSPNLTIDLDVIEKSGQEIHAEHGELATATQDVTLRVEVCNTGTLDARKTRIKKGEKTDTSFYTRLPGSGTWTQIGREETRDRNLKAGQCHTEKMTYTVPNIPGTASGFKLLVMPGMKFGNPTKATTPLVRKSLPSVHHHLLHSATHCRTSATRSPLSSASVTTTLHRSATGETGRTTIATRNVRTRTALSTTTASTTSTSASTRRSTSPSTSASTRSTSAKGTNIARVPNGTRKSTKKQIVRSVATRRQSTICSDASIR